MISIIICSANSEKICEIEENISNTIGTEFELVFIDNSKSQYSIFQAYNQGVKKSKFPILCFMHDDIIYHTTNWGRIISNHFSEKNIGMIGVDGTSYISNIPGTWWSGGIKLSGTGEDINFQNSIDTDKYTLQNRNQPVINPKNELRSEVIVLDGLWFCIRKDLFSNISFDEKVFKGFHFYDLDISLQIHSQEHKIFVIYDLIIEHFSDSRYDKQWILSCLKFYKKWNNQLPISVYPILDKTKKLVDFESSRVLINLLKSNRLYMLIFKYPLLMLKIFFVYCNYRLYYKKTG